MKALMWHSVVALRDRTHLYRSDVRRVDKAVHHARLTECHLVTRQATRWHSVNLPRSANRDTTPVAF